MIEQVPIPKGWNKHHTLYYRRWYKSRQITNDWRESPVMIVPMDIHKHAELHENVPPEDPTPSDALAGYALHVCDELKDGQGEVTHYEAFSIVRDELHDLHKKRPRRDIGKEALRFVKFFDDQLCYMSEIPVL